jgi:hypothetical protein
MQVDEGVGWSRKGKGGKAGRAYKRNRIDGPVAMVCGVCLRGAPMTKCGARFLDLALCFRFGGRPGCGYVKSTSMYRGTKQPKKDDDEAQACVRTAPAAHTAGEAGTSCGSAQSTTGTARADPFLPSSGLPS